MILDDIPALDRHSGEGRNPAARRQARKKNWTPASAGVTTDDFDARLNGVGRPTPPGRDS